MKFNNIFGIKLPTFLGMIIFSLIFGYIVKTIYSKPNISQFNPNFKTTICSNDPSCEIGYIASHNKPELCSNIQSNHTQNISPSTCLELTAITNGDKSICDSSCRSSFISLHFDQVQKHRKQILPMVILFILSLLIIVFIKKDNIYRLSFVYILSFVATAAILLVSNTSGFKYIDATWEYVPFNKFIELVRGGNAFYFLAFLTYIYIPIYIMKKVCANRKAGQSWLKYGVFYLITIILIDIITFIITYGNYILVFLGTIVTLLIFIIGFLMSRNTISGNMSSSKITSN